jgi:hypothetical protein
VSGFTITQVITNTIHTLGNDASGLDDARFSHNLVGAFALLDRMTGYALQSISGFQLAVNILEVGIFLLVVVVICRHEMPAWTRLAALVICMTVFAPESHDYTLIHLFLPLALVGRDGLCCRRRWLIAGLFAAMLVPMSWIPYESAPLFAQLLLNYSIIIYPVILLALLAVVLSSGVASEG